MNKEIDIFGVVLKTERLTLRPFILDDLDDFFEYASVDGVGQMAGWLPHKNKDKSLEILKRFIEEKRTFAIVYNNKVIGSIGIEKYNEKVLPEFSDKEGREIGYALAKDYWGKGLMPEGVKAVIEYCFNVLNLDFLTCGHFLSNNQSRRVQEKCGFRHYIRGKYETRYGEIKDHWLSILENKNKQNYSRETNILIQDEILSIQYLNETMYEDIWKNSLDENNRRFVPDEVFETLEETKEVVDSLIKSYEEIDGPFIYALFRKEDNKNIGYVQQVKIDEGWEIGYHVAENFTCKGYATRAVNLFLDYLKNYKKLDEIYGICLSENLASKRVLEKTGFIPYFEGEGLYQGAKRKVFKSKLKLN